ncbi:hypothetical protein LguiA_009491 [Lonicera macranthoides]
MKQKQNVRGAFLEVTYNHGFIYIHLYIHPSLQLYNDYALGSSTRDRTAPTL